MLQYRLLSAVGLVLCVLGLAACAHSPQQLDPVPKLKEAVAPIGQGQPVSVRVVDGRSSETLGTRGGLYPETSAVSVPRARILPRLQAEVEAGVRLMGFTPAGAGAAPQLTVTLAELRYQSPKDDLYVTEAKIVAVLRVDAKSSSRTYSGRYSASLDQHFGMAPNEQTNTELVSNVLSDALTRVFKDQNIGPVLLR